MTLPSFPMRSLALCAALCSAALHAPAQNLQELHEAARGFDAAYQSARAQFEASQARADQARAGLLPQVGASGGVNRTHLDVHVGPGSSDRTYTTQTASLVASQPLYRPANRIGWNQARQQAELSRLQMDSVDQDLIVRVSQAYFDVLAAQDTLAFVRAQKSAVGEQLQAAQRNFEVGNATITDSREAQARDDLVRAQEIAAENDLRVKRLALEQLTGRVLAEPWPLALPVQLPEVLPADVNEWVSQAAQSNPGVQQLKLARDVARLETEKARTGHLPTVDLKASYGITRNPNGNPSVAAAPNASYRSNAATVGVAINVPLFAGFAVQNRIRETLSLEEKAQADQLAAERNVAQAARAAYFGVQSGIGQVRALEAAEASSQTALDANLLGYQVGVRINIDVLNAQSQLYQTKRDLAVARYNVLLGTLRLRQAAGTLAPADVAAINALLVPPPAVPAGAPLANRATAVPATAPAPTATTQPASATAGAAPTTPASPAPAAPGARGVRRMP